MVTIKNKFILSAAGLWVSGIALVLLGAYGKNHQWQLTGTLLTIGIIAQAVSFGLMGYVIMQAVLKKK